MISSKRTAKACGIAPVIVFLVLSPAVFNTPSSHAFLCLRATSTTVRRPDLHNRRNPVAPCRLEQSIPLVSAKSSRYDAWESRNSYHLMHATPRSPRLRRRRVSTRMATNGSSDSNGPIKRTDKYFDPQTTVALIGGQSSLIAVAAVLAFIFRTPNLGLGPNFSLDSGSVQSGCLLAIPLGVLAGYLDTIEDRYPALQEVTRATQRSVLSLLGGTFKPLIGLAVSIVLGIAAGVGEEMLFRGLLQYELLARTGLGIAVSMGLSSVIFGLLHAVTPLYAIMAALASLYFGSLYVVFDNLAVPIACHSAYDVGALLYAHWTVSRLTDQERADLASWTGPVSSSQSQSKR